MTSRVSLRCLQAATALVFAYLCAGELLPLPVLKIARERVLQEWQRQQVILLALLSCLAVLVGFLVPRGGGSGSLPGVDDPESLYTSRMLVTMNVVPVVAAAATTPWIVTSDYCLGREQGCDGLTVLLDALGLVSAKLARLDLGVSFLLATRGKSAWLFGATGGTLGSAETISLHRTAGWWCAWQSALHAAAYLLYYLHEGGARLLWLRCFPVPDPGGNPVNRLGLINWFGVLACLPAFLLALSALPSVRRFHYHVFQRLHLPLALAFTTCCALHDLPILLFAAPGLADWYLGRRDEAAPVRLRAEARTLRGTSGPWIELKMDRDNTIAARMARSAGCAPRGRWASIRVVSLGRESHPLSVASVSAATAPGSFSAIVSANSGDWSRALAALAARDGDDDDENTGEIFSSKTECDVEVSGPYPTGGGGWSLPVAKRTCLPVGEPAPALLLIAGGTGITGWLPAMEAAASAASATCGSGCRLVWCVKTEADYLALASRLPRATSKGSDGRAVRYNGVDVSVFITRGDERVPEGILYRKEDEHNRNPPHRAVEEKEILGIGRMASAKSPSPLADTASYYVGCDGDSCASSAFDAAPIVSLGVALLGLVVQHWGWWGWFMIDHKTTRFGSPQTMIGYAVIVRVLPVAVVVGSMAAATVIGLRCIRALRTGRMSSVYRTGMKDEKGYIKFCDEEDGRVEAGGSNDNCGEEDTGVIDEEQGGIAGSDDVDGLSEAGTGLDRDGTSHPFVREEEGRHSLLRTVEIEDVLSENPEISVLGHARDCHGHDVRVGRPNIEALVRAAVAGMRQEPSPTTGQLRLVVAACGPSEMVETTREAVADCNRSYKHCIKRVQVEFSGAAWRW